MGHEGFARVLEIGPGTSRRGRQQRGAALAPWCRDQSEPPRYRWKGKPLNAGWVTTFNRHAVVSENRCTTIPADTDPDAAHCSAVL